MAEVIEVKTIGEVERIVLGSGLWAGTGPVEFSNNGAMMSWAEVWLPSEEFPHPVFARVEVHRKDVPIPTRVTIRWDEQFPEASEEWAAKWARSPMRHFGRTARMVAYRQAFRDLLGDLVIEDEPDAHEPMPGQDAEPAPRDWAAEFAAAETVEQLDVIVKDARKARVFTPTAEGTALDRAWKSRRKEILARAALEAEPAPKPTPADIAKHVHPEPEQKPRPKKPRRAPHQRAKVADRIEADVADALRTLGSKKA